jgi:hypothetical protein
MDSGEFMKNFMVIALVMASLSSVAQAATNEINLDCKVITNGNGSSWEEIASYSKKVSKSEKFNELEFKVSSKYGENFDVQVNLLLSSSALLTVGLDIPDTIASIQNQNRGQLDQLDVNNNIVVTNTTFTLKKTSKNYITYQVSCIAK